MERSHQAIQCQGFGWGTCGFSFHSLDKNEYAIWPLSLQAMPALKSGGCRQVRLQLQSLSFWVAVPGSTLDAGSSVRWIGSRMSNCTPGPLPESRPSCCGIFTDRSLCWIWVPHMGPTSEGRSWQPRLPRSGNLAWCSSSQMLTPKPST